MPLPVEEITGFSFGITLSEFQARCQAMGGAPYGVNHDFCEVSEPHAFVSGRWDVCDGRMSELWVHMEDPPARETVKVLAGALCDALGSPNIVHDKSVSWAWSDGESLNVAWDMHAYAVHPGFVKLETQRCPAAPTDAGRRRPFGAVPSLWARE